MSEIGFNPFAVKTPESLSAEDIVELFVPYPEFENLHDSGHQFLHGHRGSGKSMMLRMMSPDSQCIVKDCNVSDLPYFGVYISIKATELNSPEYARLESETSGTILSEHVLVTRLLSALFMTVSQYARAEVHLEKLATWVKNKFLKRLMYAGLEGGVPTDDALTFTDTGYILDFLISTIDDVQLITSSYIKKRSFGGNQVSYNGPLLGFQDILLPLIESMKDERILPNVPVYFLLDDADNLSRQQTQVLNTWVSYRSTNTVSLKISTQLNYKTYETTSGTPIQSPHDFSHINFTSVHTGSVKERYPAIVSEILKKRLIKYGIKDPEPYAFFPEDEAQKAKINEIGLSYREKWEQGNSGAYRAADDSYRYAKPEYIRQLALSKQKYKYAGFDQQVHISSGIIRFFLEPAARMFTEQLLQNGTGKVDKISVSIQDQELRKQADQLLLQDFDDLETTTSNDVAMKDIQRLRNIVHGVGAIFRAYIMDETATQRRVFSFSISGEASSEIKLLLQLGVINGYFYKDSIGDKTGMTRNTLYVLTRRLAPAFSLDPTGFSGYLTITNDILLSIAENPKNYMNRLRKKPVEEVLKESPQISLLGE